MKKTIFITVFIIILIISLGFYIYLKSNTTIISFNETNGTSLVIEDKVIHENTPVIVENNVILMSLSIVKTHIDSNVYWDEGNSIVIFTTKDKVIRMKVGENIVMVNGRPVELESSIKIYNDTPYVPVEFLSEDYGFNIEYIKETDIVVMDNYISYIRKAEVIDNKGNLRKEPTKKSPLFVKKLEIGSSMRIFEEYDNWYKVRTQMGIVGFVEKKFVKVIYEEMVTDRNQIIVENVNKSKDKINLVWEYVHNKNPNIESLKTIDGLDVISPTWFSVEDKEGTIKSKADKEYVKWAKDNGYKIWALVDNSFDPDLTHEILKDSIKREKIIQELLYYANIYNLDGINIDFENVYLKDKDLLTQFVRELTPIFRENGLTVSMDVTVKSNSENWSLCYDRKALGEIVDYIVVMTYDQHWATSPKAGSVAQYSWVENGLKGILEEVPSQKVLLGVPFYTRIWKIENIEGNEKVSSKAVSMERAYEVVKENNAHIIWDEESGQYYAEYSKGNVAYKVWLEDEKSINLKSSLVHKYNLAGVASWRKGFESEEVWQVLNDSLKIKQNYYQWANSNGYQDEIF